MTNPGTVTCRLPAQSRPYETSVLSRWTALAIVVVSMSLLTGFAPFNGKGLAQFRVLEGSGELLEVDPADADWKSVETDAVFHTLSSRYGGGGVFSYMEYLPVRGVSGVLLIDFRHAGLPDLRESEVELPDRRRAEVFYQEWNTTRDLFESDAAQGSITVLDMYRGQGASAIVFEYDITFFDYGADGKRDTSDDRWRRVQGAATTTPNVEQLLRREGGGLYTSSSGNSGSDGDIVVNCFGATTVEETEYDEDSYVVEDDSSSCEGDTWEDDAEEPDETGGCAGKRNVDEGDPDPDGGCESSGPDIDEDYESDDDGSFYDADDSGDDGGCEEDDSDYDDDSDTSTSSDGCDSSCEGDEAEAAVSTSEHSIQARYLARMTNDRYRQRLHRMRSGRWSPVAWRTVRQMLGYAPYLLLGIVIHTMRRRMRARRPGST